jgi:DNA sulfur modification protein DndE
MDYETRQRILEAQFRVAREVSEFCQVLRLRLGLEHNNEVARLCIARSLHDSAAPQPVLNGRDLAPAMRGRHLFGEDGLDLWLCTLLEGGGLGKDHSIEAIRPFVEAHWERGCALLRDDWEAADRDQVNFILRLATCLPQAGETAVHRAGIPSVGGLISVPVGEISRAVLGEASVAVPLNAPSVAPHIALLGKNGSGKSRTGMTMAAHIVKAAEIPVLILDPKSEFCKGGRVDPKLAERFPGIRGISLGDAPIPLDFLPDRSVGDFAINKATMRFRDSLARCVRGAGDVQMQNLRDAVESVIRSGGPRDIETIRRAYQAILTRAGKDSDSIDSRLGDLTKLKVFDAKLPAHQFFSQSWVIGLKDAPSEEVRRLALLLLLDAFSSWSLGQPESVLVDGHRTIRHLLVIDEARRILKEKKYESLVDLLREGRSKGQVVMLLSQDPSDFVGQNEDFMGQIGTVVAFLCNAQTGLAALQGAYQRKLQPAEFSDVELPEGVAFCKLPNRAAEKILCWSR